MPYLALRLCGMRQWVSRLFNMKQLALRLFRLRWQQEQLRETRPKFSGPRLREATLWRHSWAASSRTVSARLTTEMKDHFLEARGSMAGELRKRQVVVDFDQFFKSTPTGPANNWAVATDEVSWTPKVTALQSFINQPVESLDIGIGVRVPKHWVVLHATLRLPLKKGSCRNYAWHTRISWDARQNGHDTID